MKRARRPLYALPKDVNLNDYDFEPLPKLRRPRLTEAQFLKRKAENRLAKLRKLKAQWDQEELAYLQRRAKELAVEIERGRAWIERQNELEQQLSALQSYYKTELAKEQAAEDKKRREKLASITREINADICRTERETLARRGQIRGRRS